MKRRYSWPLWTVAGVVVLLVAGPWMITTLVEYLRRMLQAIPSMVG